MLQTPYSGAILKPARQEGDMPGAGTEIQHAHAHP
jgi:hypothetical protein